ncbi:MAG: hypothetical protein J6B31_04495, partial [Bacteroidaceae bacterium]|nr:hypothetical protein [Bacteroidaceae bacterium]
DRLEQLASKANMTPEERWQYEEEWKNLSDYVNTHAYAMKTGMEKGLKEGLEKGLAEGMEKGLKEGLEKGLEKGLAEGERKSKAEIALNLKKAGMTPEFISQITGLSTEEIEKLQP